MVHLNRTALHSVRLLLEYSNLSCDCWVFAIERDLFIKKRLSHFTHSENFPYQNPVCKNSSLNCIHAFGHTAFKLHHHSYPKYHEKVILTIYSDRNEIGVYFIECVGNKMLSFSAFLFSNKSSFPEFDHLDGLSKEKFDSFLKSSSSAESEQVKTFLPENCRKDYLENIGDARMFNAVMDTGEAGSSAQ